MPKRKRRSSSLEEGYGQDPGQGGQKKSEASLADSPFAALGALRARLVDAERKAKDAAAVKRRSPKAPPPPAQDSASAEEALWKLATADVTPLAQERTINRPTPKRPADWPASPPADDDFMVIQALTDLVAGRSEFDLTYTDEYVEGHVKGFPPPSMERLRMGLIPYQDHLDLHGQTLAQAEEAIYDFISKSVGLGRSCLLLIHGRGHRSPGGFSVIKKNLESLLLHRRVKRHILAFTTAKPIDGGLGASYILLRPPGPVRKS
ncbi:MAG: Smr/MutS family protein [Deltaproteobacteria bacterium]|jgi:DNA-nicking Smr family endonuclease|nr:Smr/MutS family protein [Deltaproteobacteria bacterium]